MTEVFADPAGGLRLSGFADSTALRLGGTSLPGLEGDDHRRRRRIVEPVFADPSVFSTAVTDAAATATAGWRSGSAVNAQDEMERISLAAVLRVVFGEDGPREQASLEPYYAVSRKAVYRIVNPLSPLLWRLPLPLTRRFARAQRTFNVTVEKMIASRRAGAAGDDLLARLLEGGAGDGGGLSDIEARDEAWTYYSQAAPMYVLTWVWWLLGRHREIEERLHEEVDAIDDARVGRLPLTRAIVLETMRLYPPGWALVHPTAREHEVAGHRLAARTTLLVSPWVLHRDGRFWPEPERFDPDRWLDDRDDARAEGSFVAFSAGPRRCPARPFAELLCTLVVAAVARHWRLRPSVAPVTLAYVPFLRPKGGLPVVLERRNA